MTRDQLYQRQRLRHPQGLAIEWPYEFYGDVEGFEPPFPYRAKNRAYCMMFLSAFHYGQLPVPPRHRSTSQPFVVASACPHQSGLASHSPCGGRDLLGWTRRGG
jgi:hypothetical protein